MQSFIFTGLQANSPTVANLYLPSVLWPSIHPQVQERTDYVGSVFSLLSFARSLLFFPQVQRQADVICHIKEEHRWSSSSSGHDCAKEPKN